MLRECVCRSIFSPCSKFSIKNCASSRFSSIFCSPNSFRQIPRSSFRIENLFYRHRNDLLLNANFQRQFSSGFILKQLKSEENKKSDDEAENAKKRNRTVLLGVVSLGSIVGGLLAYFGLCGFPAKDEQGHAIIDQFGPGWSYSRALRSVTAEVNAIKEPSRDVLLPNPIKAPYYQPKYTVVFEISGVLVHPEWTFNTGWRFKKRQGVDYFLKLLSYPFTEMVVYTSESGLTANAIVDNLDPEQNIMYRLYRDCTKYDGGTHIKVLDKLNRDMSKVIFIDWDNSGFRLNPENALRVKKWDGDDDDMSLVDLAHLIRTIVDLDVPDVRPVLQYYSSCDDPVEAFRENTKKLQEQESLKHSSRDTQKQSLVAKWSRGMFKKN